MASRPWLAQSGPSEMCAICPLSGAKETSASDCLTIAIYMSTRPRVNLARRDSNEQTRRREHNPRDKCRQARKQQKVIQYSGSHGTLPYTALSQAPQPQRVAGLLDCAGNVGGAQSADLGVVYFITDSSPTPGAGRRETNRAPACTPVQHCHVSQPGVLRTRIDHRQGDGIRSDSAHAGFS
jgi:hypothetical protein